jgi:hypothetical protein
MENNSGKGPDNLKSEELDIVLKPDNPEPNMEPEPIAVPFEEEDLEDSADSQFFNVVFEIIGDFFIKSIQK